MKTILHFARVILVMMMVVPYTHANDSRQFDIEVIFFKRVLDLNSLKEEFPDNIRNISIRGTGSLFFDDYRHKNQVTLLNPSHYALQNAKQKLENDSAFKILFHQAWRQSDKDRRDAPRFLIQAGDQYPESLDISRKYELYGTFQVSVQKFLYAELDLDLTVPYLPKSNNNELIPMALNESSPSFKSFAITQKIQMRSNNTYYVDHPLFGAIIQVRRVTL